MNQNNKYEDLDEKVESASFRIRKNNILATIQYEWSDFPTLCITPDSKDQNAYLTFIAGLREHGPSGIGEGKHEEGVWIFDCNAWTRGGIQRYKVNIEQEAEILNQQVIFSKNQTPSGEDIETMRFEPTKDDKEMFVSLGIRYQ